MNTTTTTTTTVSYTHLSDLKSDDTEKKICTCLSVQFSGWICIQ